MNEVIIGLGSNIDPHRNTEAALQALQRHFSVVAQSRFIVTKPVGGWGQADFWNGAVRVKAEADLDDIKEILQEIECSLGRPKNHDSHGPRTIDLDILVINGVVIDEDVYERKFLQDNICDVAPEMRPVITSHGKG